MRSIADIAISAIISLVIAGVSTVYMVTLKAPSVLEVRPELAEVSFWTAFFSGRFSAWLFHHYPIEGFLSMFVLFFIITLLSLWIQ